ncbi:hypothetical protein [Paraperlucidibaca sp.]|jgi:hypothetical protein|uniref:hypothetical protein n=1 Tax=Paraperlucidibaca sp. TaxID=2708021 RepID=UPI0030F4AB09
MAELSLPYVCLPLSAEIPERTRRIDTALSAGVRESQAKPAAETMALAINALVDQFLSQLLRDLYAAYPTHKNYKTALNIIDDIQEKVLHYLQWLTRFLSNERMAVVVKNYLEMMRHLSASRPEQAYLAVGLAPELAARGRKTINALRSGESTDVAAGIEVLIDIIDAVLVDFVYEPKRLMRFNLVVNKGLDGAIYMIKGLAFRQLRTLGEMIPPEHVSVFLDHLEHHFFDLHPVQ